MIVYNFLISAYNCKILYLLYSLLGRSSEITSSTQSQPETHNLATNIISEYQNQHQIYGHYDYLVNAPPVTSVAASEIQNTDPGRTIISTEPKQAPSETLFLSPSTSVHVRRVVHSEAYIRYLYFPILIKLKSIC